MTNESSSALQRVRDRFDAAYRSGRRLVALVSCENGPDAPPWHDTDAPCWEKYRERRPVQESLIADDFGYKLIGGRRSLAEFEQLSRQAWRALRMLGNPDSLGVPGSIIKKAATLKVVSPWSQLGYGFWPVLVAECAAAGACGSIRAARLVWTGHPSGAWAQRRSKDKGTSSFPSHSRKAESARGYVLEPVELFAASVEAIADLLEHADAQSPSDLMSFADAARTVVADRSTIKRWTQKVDGLRDYGGRVSRAELVKQEPKLRQRRHAR